MATKFKPIGKNILVLPETEKELKSKGGIILNQDTHDALKKNIKAKVVAVSDELKDVISVGDTVHYQKMYELTFTLNDVRHVILKEEHILGVEKV